MKTEAAKAMAPKSLHADQPAKTIAREEPPRTLKPGRFQISEFARVTFDATMAEEHDFEDALKPGYWVNVAEKLRKNPTTNEPDRTGALIDLCTEDHAFYARLYVRAVLTSGLIVQCIGPAFDAKTGKACPVDLITGKAWQGRKSAESDHFDVKWNVGVRGFDIIRKSDRQIVVNGSNFPTREMAEEWIKKTTAQAA